MKWFFATKKDETFNARDFHPRFCKTDVMWCGNFQHFYWVRFRISVFIQQDFLKFSVTFIKVNTKKIQNAKIQKFFRKDLAREFESGIFFQFQDNIQAEFYSAEWIWSVKFYFHAEIPLVMWCQKSVFLSQVRNLFSPSSRKWIQTLFSRIFGLDSVSFNSLKIVEFI